MSKKKYLKREQEEQGDPSIDKLTMNHFLKIYIIIIQLFKL